MTGGPTRAYLDDVRYLSNVSSGKTAYEICKLLSKEHFDVVAVVGPTLEPFENLNLKQLIPVETNQEMRKAVHSACKKYRPEFAIFSAAVLDFEPTIIQKKKVSSHQKKWTIHLKPAPKIIDEVRKKFPKIKIFGFKLESKKIRNKEKFVQSIIEKKNLLGLCFNYLEEVEKSRHVSYLTNSQGETKTGRTKKEIALWIASQIRKVCYTKS